LLNRCLCWQPSALIAFSNGSGIPAGINPVQGRGWGRNTPSDNIDGDGDGVNSSSRGRGWEAIPRRGIPRRHLESQLTPAPKPPLLHSFSYRSPLPADPTPADPRVTATRSLVPPRGHARKGGGSRQPGTHAHIVLVSVPFAIASLDSVRPTVHGSSVSTQRWRQEAMFFSG
jgi:hypothetical protein